jgi:hypothetical protein
MLPCFFRLSSGSGAGRRGGALGRPGENRWVVILLPSIILVWLLGLSLLGTEMVAL